MLVFIILLLPEGAPKEINATQNGPSKVSLQQKAISCHFFGYCWPFDFFFVFEKKVD